MNIMFVHCSAQSFDDDNNIVLLKEFYYIHQTYIYKDSVSLFVDSIYAKYCTEALIDKAKKLRKFDHDMYTDDWGITKEALNSLTIQKNALRDNSYIVTYSIDTYPISPYNAVKKQIILNLTIINVKGVYKIDSISSLSNGSEH